MRGHDSYTPEDAAAQCKAMKRCEGEKKQEKQEKESQPILQIQHGPWHEAGSDVSIGCAVKSKTKVAKFAFFSENSLGSSKEHIREAHEVPAEYKGKDGPDYYAILHLDDVKLSLA